MLKHITKEILNDLYIIKKLSTIKIGKQLNCNHITIRNYLLKYNIPIRKLNETNKGNIKYIKNKKYFSIPTIENCYWAGFIAADGCIQLNPDRLQIILSNKDKNILENFKNAVSYNGPIREVVRHYKNTKHKQKEYKESHLTINSSQIITDLNKIFNITIQKSLTLKPPNLTNLEHQLAYIIGYIDGDGSICLCNSKSSKDKQINLSILGTLELLNWMYQILHRLENPKYNPIKCTKQANIYRLKFVSIRAFKILKELEKVKTPFKLPRKWDNIQLIQNIKNKNERNNQYKSI